MGGLVLFLWLGLEVMRGDVGLRLDCDGLSMCVEVWRQARERVWTETVLLNGHCDTACQRVLYSLEI